MADLLSGIINPLIADPAAGFRAGQQRGEAKIAEGLVGDVLGQTFGGKLGELGKIDPNAALELSKVLGIPTTSEGRLKKFVGDTQAVSTIFDGAGPEAAAQYLAEQIQVLDSGGPADQILKAKYSETIQSLRSGDPTVIKRVGDALRTSMGQFIENGFIKSPEGFTLGKDQVRFDPEGEIIARGPSATGAAPQIPQQLLEGLSPSSRAKGKAAFDAAGGGKDGVKAFNEAVKLDRETTQRGDIPQVIETTYPNASPAEIQELQSAAQAAKTPEAGLKNAASIRTEQRRLKKAKGFQERAVQLLDNILASDQLGDVTGSIEGAIDFRFSDAEAEIIADIDEAQNILTAENMDLMTGVLSESDIKLLKNLSSGGLNRKRGLKRFEKDAQTMRDKLSAQLVTTVDDTQPPQTTQQQDTQPDQLGANQQIMEDAQGNRAIVDISTGRVIREL